MSTLDGLQDALDVAGIFCDVADVVNMVISLCRGQFKEAGMYGICFLLPVVGDFLVKGVKGLKGLTSVGADLATGAVKSSDEIIDTLCLTYRASGDAAELSRYLDDVAEMIPAGGNARLMLEGGEILNGNSRIVLEIYDDTGNVVSRINMMDDIADSRVLKELGGASHLDDAEDILSATRGLDDIGTSKVGTRPKEDVTYLLNSGKTPDDLLKEGYSVDDLLEAGVNPNDLQSYYHLVTGDGLVRRSAQVKGGHNIDSFYAAIKQDAQKLGLDISDYDIKVTEHPTIKGLYQMEYRIPLANGNTNPMTPIYDDMGRLLTKPADEFKTVYNTAEIGFSDIEIYKMGKQALEAEILAGNVNGYNVYAKINGITFKGYYRDGVLTNFHPIFE